MTSDSLVPAAAPLLSPIRRRSFFRYAGATAGTAALVLAGCNKQDAAPGLVAVGRGDAGILNYAYALEQLEAAFYTQVRGSGYYLGLPPGGAEQLALSDLYYHEIIHRDFLRTAIIAAGATPIKALKPDFSSITFTDRASVLGAAKAFEDLGVAAYNGVGQYISSPAYLLLAGKIVSVEARHAALIRDLLADGTFVGNDVLTLAEGTSLERSRTPADVASAANAFLADGSKLDVSGIM